MKYKRLLTLFLLLAVMFSLFLPVTASDCLELEAQSAVLLDASTGQVLYSKGMHRKMHPASITKILTGLLVVENANPQDKLIISDSAIDLPYDSASIWLREGEVITVEEAMYALMVGSANDAANALAEHIAGSQEEFAKMMNQRCQQIGAVNTHFDNAHGLTSPSHLTTAYDMALITQEAINNPDFMKYFGVSLHIIPETNLLDQERFLFNHHYMLREGMWAYCPEVICGKTGYTKSAGSTLCTVAEDNGRTLISVVLKSTADGKFLDTQAMLDYGFENFATYNLPVLSTEDLILPLVDDQLGQIGEAVYKVPETVSVSLNKNQNSSQVQMKLEHPNELKPNDTATSYLNLYNPGDNVDFASPILEIPLEYEIELYETNSDSLLVTPPVDETRTDLFYTGAVWSILGILFIIGVVAALHKLKNKKRKSYY